MQQEPSASNEQVQRMVKTIPPLFLDDHLDHHKANETRSYKGQFVGW